MKNLTVVSIAFLVLLILLWNPLYLWMPTELQYLIVAALAVVAATFAGLVIGEKARDEREEELRAHAARAGYLTGIFVLILSIVASAALDEHVSVWVLATLAAMILVRVFVRSKGE